MNSATLETVAQCQLLLPVLISVFFSRAPIELWMLRFTSSAFNEWFVTTQIDHILRSLYSWNYEWLRFMRFSRVIPSSHCYQTCLNFLTLYTRCILCNSGMQTTILFTSFRPYTESQETKKAETLGFISLFWKQNSLRNISSQLYDLVKLFCSVGTNIGGDYCVFSWE